MVETTYMPSMAGVAKKTGSDGLAEVFRLEKRAKIGHNYQMPRKARKARMTKMARMAELA